MWIFDIRLESAEHCHQVAAAGIAGAGRLSPYVVVAVAAVVVAVVAAAAAAAAAAVAVAVVDAPRP